MGNIIGDCKYCSRSDRIEKQNENIENEKKTSFNLFLENIPSIQVKDYLVLKHLYDDI